MLVSSANILGEAPHRKLGRLLMYIKKSIPPWDTPQLTVRVVDSLPFTLHFWVRLLKYDWNHLTASWSAPKYDILRKIISWSIESNAFLRSMKTTPFRVGRYQCWPTSCLLYDNKKPNKSALIWTTTKSQKFTCLNETKKMFSVMTTPLPEKDILPKLKCLDDLTTCFS